MEIVLYRYTGERNLIDKSADLVMVESLRGDIKGDMDVLNPTILITLIANADGSYKDFNYFWITETKRFYFVTSITLSSKNLMMVTGQVDPLYTYMDGILNQSVFVERNEFEYNEMLPDSLMPLSNYAIANTLVLPEVSNTHKNFRFITDYSTSNGASLARNVAVTVIGNYPDGASSSYDGKTKAPYDYLPIASNFDFFANGNVVWTMKQHDFMLLTHDVKMNSIASPYILNTLVFPFEVPTGKSDPRYGGKMGFEYPDGNGTSTTFKSTGDADYIMPLSDYLVLSEFEIPSSPNFNLLEPFAKYEIYLPFYGWVDFGIKSRIKHTLMVYYTCEYSNGKGMVYLYDVTKKELMFYSPVQLGYPIPLNVTNYAQMENQRNALYNSMITGLMGNSLNMVSGTLSENYGKALGAGLGMAGDVISYFNAIKQIYPSVKSNIGDGGNNLLTPLNVILRWQYQPILLTDLTLFAYDFGRPLMQYRTLSSMTGFTKALSAHVTGIEATKEEIASIESALMSGVYI